MSKLFTITLKDAKGLNEAAMLNPTANILGLGVKYYNKKTYINFYEMIDGKFANIAMTDGHNIFLLDEIEIMVEQ